ncbi:MAG: enoyl-CoA hydratase-related protein [Alphaproteobacteria bacterium]|nr:enoyl-CoA hydratase-related protein [Alphaproteobacteria bacterium]
MRTDYETLTLEMSEDHILKVILDRPDAANSMNTQMGFDLRSMWADLYHDPTVARCIVLTGHGEKIFCAGGDLKQRNGMSDKEWLDQHAIFEQGVKSMMDCPIPIIGAINGAAYGGGCELALNCDFLYAAEHARFALTEVTLGIMPGAAGTQNMPRAVGVRRAMEVILTGMPLSAAEALEYGLVNSVCPLAKLTDKVMATARRIASNAPIAIRQAKKSIRMATQLDLKSGYDFEIEAYNRMVSSKDRLEGVLAFNDKRKPNFKGH